MARNPLVINKGDNSSEEVYKAPTEIHLPDIPSAFGNLLEFFYGAGQYSNTGMGIISLTWNDIKNYREENDIEMMLWERDAVRRMSSAYCAEYYEAKDPKRPCPYKPVQDELDEEQAQEAALRKALAFREVLKGFRGNKN